MYSEDNEFYISLFSFLQEKVQVELDFLVHCLYEIAMIIVLAHLG